MVDTLSDRARSGFASIQGQTNVVGRAPASMDPDNTPITIQNDLQLLLFMRIWTSRGEFALSTVKDFVNKSASRQIELPEIPNRNLKSELSEMKDNLSILLRRLE